MKAVIAGAGGMGRAWGRNLLELGKVEVVGWVDPRAGAVDEAKAETKWPNAQGFTDIEKAILATKPDFVVDVTPPEAHQAITLASLGLGVPVLGEKPMAHSMEAAREMVLASKNSGKLYMVSQSRRYDARIVAFRELLSKIGPVGILNVDFYIGAHFGGFRDAMESPLIVDMAIHTFDQARLLSGTDPVAVYCEEFNPSWSWYAGDVCATALFEMSGGLRYTYRGSWCSEGLNTSWEGDWRAVGQHGTARWDGHGSIEAEIVRGGEGFIRAGEIVQGAPASGVHGGISGSIREFIHALETGSTPQGECRDNIKSFAMVMAAVESSRTGKRVAIPPMYEDVIW